MSMPLIPSAPRLETATRTMTFEVEQLGYQQWELEDGSLKKVINWDMDEVDYVDIAFIFKQEETAK